MNYMTIGDGEIVGIEFRWDEETGRQKGNLINMTLVDASTLPDHAKVFNDRDAERTLIRENVGDFQAMLQGLYEQYGIVNLMLECGGNLLREFLQRGLVNEWVQIITPRLTGGPDLMLPGYFMPEERVFVQEEMIPSGRDFILRGIIR